MCYFLQDMIVHPVRYALDYYRKLNEAVKDEQRQQRKSVVTLEPINSCAVTSPNSPSGGAHGGSSISAVLEAKMSQQVRIGSLQLSHLRVPYSHLNFLHLFIEVGGCVHTFRRRRPES